MREKTGKEKFPLYETDGFTFSVRDDGMLGKLTGFSIALEKGLVKNRLAVSPLYD